MAIRISEEEKYRIVEDRLSGMAIADLSKKYGKTEIWLKRHLTRWLSPEERKMAKALVFGGPEFREKNRLSQLHRESLLPEVQRQERDSRLRRQSEEFSERVRSGTYLWSEEELLRRSQHGSRVGNSEKHIESMKRFAQERKKYFPDVIEKHFSSFGLSFQGDLSSSENYVVFSWPDGKTRSIQIKRAMLLSEIPAPCISRTEKEILQWVNCLGFSAQKKRIQGREIDIFVEELGIGIEMNGMFWHSDICKDKNYHLDKTLFFKERGIQIIHVFEEEWLTRREQVQNYLLSKLKKNRVVGARKLQWRFIEPSLAFRFLQDNHIQGGNRLSVSAVGGFLDEKLVVCASFGRHHRKNTGIVLNRFACEKGLSIAGALSKISKMVSLHYGQPIYSWADLRWSNGNGYVRSGWQIEETLPPDYFYWSARTGIVAKQSRMKSRVGTPEGMTEAEHAEQDGLLRIWDCGKIRLAFLPRK